MAGADPLPGRIAPSTAALCPLPSRQRDHASPHLPLNSLGPSCAVSKIPRRPLFAITPITIRRWLGCS